MVPVVEALAGAVRRTGRRGPGLGRHGQARGGHGRGAGAGASLVNDISASLWEVAAAAGAGWVAMHMQGQPRTMQDDPRYEDVVGEVRTFVLERARRALAAGVREVWVDPGIGFGKTPAHNLVAAAPPAGAGGGGRRRRLRRGGWSGRAASASSAMLAAGPGRQRAGARWPSGREGSLATAAAALVAGVGMLRVHDVAATVQMARLYGPAA